MISHLDEMFGDDKNQGEFFSEFDLQENQPSIAIPSTISEELPEVGDAWFEQVDNMDIDLMDENALEMQAITNSIAKKIIRETTEKLRELKDEFNSIKHEFNSKIKTKAIEKANEKRETFLRKKKEIHEKYKLKMNQI
jgi:hypothetical protein